MNALDEKVMFGSTLLASSASSLVGAILTTGDERWLFVTFTVSFLMSGFLALMFKRSQETIQLVVGRCGFSIFGGIFATHPIVKWAGITTAQTDVIALAGVSSCVCIATFFVGFYILKLLETHGPAIAEKWFRKFQ